MLFEYFREFGTQYFLKSSTFQLELRSRGNSCKGFKGLHSMCNLKVFIFPYNYMQCNYFIKSTLSNFEHGNKCNTRNLNLLWPDNLS